MERERDLQATYQGAVFLVTGLAAIAAISLHDRPTAQSEQLRTFIAWMVAVLAVGSGAYLARGGLRRRLYGHRRALRVVVTLLATALLALGAYIGLIAAGAVPPPTLRSGAGTELEPVEFGRGDIRAPRGWHKDGPASFSRVRGRQVMTAEVGALRGAGTEFDAADWRAGLLDGMRRGRSMRVKHASGAGRAGKVAGLATYRTTAAGSLEGVPMTWDTYALVDTEADVMWTVAFADLSPRDRGAAAVQRRFLASIPFRRLAAERG